MENQSFVVRLFSSRYFNSAAFCIIACLILAAYSNTFTSSFHFDDDQAINENPLIKHMTGENILKILDGGRPVVYLSLMLNYSLGQLNPAGWHIFNISLHIINTILVYLFILWTLSATSLRARYAEKAKWMAFFGALLFGLHPIQTESVTYIISRSELLATCFYLMTFLLLIQAAKSKKFFYSPLILITSLLSMGSKEWAVTLPALLLLYDYLFLAEGKIKHVLARWHLYVFAVLPWVHVLNRMDLFSKGGSTSVGFNVQTVSGITASSYLLTSFNVIWTYIRLLFIPVGQNIDYDYRIARTLFEFPTIVSFLGHLIVIIGGVWLYRAKKWLLVPFGIAWFYIGLSPVQSFVPVVDVIFEHRLYMPSVGFFLAFVSVYDMVFESVTEKIAVPEEPAQRNAVNKMSKKRKVKGVSLNGRGS